MASFEETKIRQVKDQQRQQEGHCQRQGVVSVRDIVVVHAGFRGFYRSVATCLVVSSL